MNKTEMDYKALCTAANKVISAIDTQKSQYASADVLASIKNQMVFTALPESKAGWRGNYAVKDSWNDNGYYTEYTVPPGDGLKVWRGTTAGQKYEVSDGKKFYLEGGKEQIFVSPNNVAPAPKKFPSWTDARS